LTEELGKSAREAAETLSEQSQKLGKTGAFQTVSQTAKIVKKELDQGGMHAHVYRPPARLRKRVETVEDMDDKVIEPNTDATGMEKKELDQGGMHAHVYRPPARLRKRVETVEDVDDKVIEPNTDATGMELHKDSR